MLNLSEQIKKNSREIAESKMEWTSKMKEFLKNETELKSELHLREEEMERLKNIEQ